ncbi:XRE family transcriptional regulator [Micromonospora globispora]|uniref:XRE family transcriptional regulator n=1 Tax=Micromonospora globispora TaxID=1450148 RepID=A0A317KEL0_9ACTN|nr:helix-turn-helix transcriptional regulator [Micromonospora globispora]PWU51954.1 XRE family transcriptional regulator [Micromonospora globispora]PWU62144.1 XRE family transcriptional regulator [Micromonospora globispora]RQW99754.1 XRE family transcriptional regulator [Micromonospora globispora]
MNVEMWVRALKAARAGADVSQEGLAALIKWSPSTVAAIETGRRRPTMEFAVAADQALTTGGLLAGLMKESDGRSEPSWFESWPGHEERAVRLCHFEPCLIPGLLQTEEYARAVFSAGGLYRGDRVERLLSFRMSRQRLLHRDDPPESVFVIDESALRRPVGGPAVMDRQLSRLLDAVELPQVRLHVLPLEVGAHVSMGGGFVLAELPGNDRLLCLDNAARGQIADYPEWIGLVQRKWEHLLGEALSESASVELIKKLKVTP